MVLIVSMFIISILGLIGVGEGDEKESLLDFSCEELTKKISTDGRDGRFVTDWFSTQFVPKELKRDAQIVKGCITRLLGLERFEYDNYKARK